ncbi:MAG TPA: 6-carboxytetrahydropterin synthase [Methylomirabilota bacterium]|jgi:6-pyruvoyltetrahydropterin/6-carboxytetrahydropterin synthase|nr:6-carboxytetrahydropterin synthase [Methylomirabilota bacterium]
MAAEATRRVQLTRVYHFSAAHCLGNPALSAADNATLYGPCSRPHGHNYYLEVTVAGVPDPLTGFAVDLMALDRAVSREVLEQVDHHTLEDAPALAGVITTGEGLARAFWRTLSRTLPAGELQRVVVQETAKNRFEYRGEEASWRTANRSRG